MYNLRGALCHIINLTDSPLHNLSAKVSEFKLFFSTKATVWKCTSPSVACQTQSPDGIRTSPANLTKD